MPIIRRLAPVFAALLLVFTCGSPPTSAPPKADAAAGGTGPKAGSRDEPNFTLIVSDVGGARSADEAKEHRATVTEGTALSETQTERLLARATGIAPKKQDVKDWALRAQSQPPPRTGKTIAVPFPPPDQVAPPTAPGPNPGAPLTVVRYAPVGDVPIAPSVQVTFSLPMVSVRDAAKGTRGVPLAIEPRPPGQWEWVGTKTAFFRSGERLPAATHYTVTIPATTKSATGVALSKAVAFHFTTPTVKVAAESFNADTPLGRRPLLLVRFNQRVDAAAIAQNAVIENGSERVAVGLATVQEIADDEKTERLASEAKNSGHAERFVVLRPTTQLPADAKLALVFDKGLPSAEGPLVTTESIRLPFRTRGEFKIASHGCSSATCTPDSGWQIEFSNPLDADEFDESGLQIAPKVEEFNAHVYGNRLVVRAPVKPQQRYAVTLPRALTDTFGQQLAGDATVEFDVGSYLPDLIAKGGMVVLDPAKAKKTYDVQTVNVGSFDVEVFRVTPKDYDAYQGRSRLRHEGDPGTRVYKKTIKLAGAQDAWIETPIDLSPALDAQGFGHAIVNVTFKRPTWSEPTTTSAWVQSTEVGLVSAGDQEEVVVWVTQLASGRPLADVDVRVVSKSKKQIARSNAEGLATLRLGGDATFPSDYTVYAKRGDDVAFLADAGGYGGQQRSGPTGFVTTDRGIYRPGEKVHFKGWIRDVSAKKGGGVSGLRSPLKEVTFRASGSRGGEVAEGSAKSSPIGAFSGSFTIPKTANLGWASISFVGTLRDGTEGEMEASFTIREFRTPEYEVTLTATEGPYFIGGRAEATVSASYYSGGPLAAASVNWVVSWSMGTFVPPGWSEFHFGRKRSPWGRLMSGGGMFSFDDPRSPRDDESQRLEGLTDGAGSHSIELAFPRANPAFPHVVDTQASVKDLNEQSWAARKDLLIHPGAVYVGVQSDAYFVHAGETLNVELAAVDLDGATVAGRPITLDADHVSSTGSGARRKPKRERVATCERTSAARPVNCQLSFERSGNYELWATTTDAEGRRNQSVLSVWVAGGERVDSQDLVGGQVRLIPNKTEYAPGETAEVLAIAPFPGAEGLLVVERSGIVSYERFAMSGSTTTLKVPITEALMPNVAVRVELVGESARGSAPSGAPSGAPGALPGQPAFASGLIQLTVSTKSRALSIDVEPEQKKLEPGASTTVHLLVTNAAGKPAAGVDTAVFIVDEAVFALDDFKTPSPLAIFYPDRAPDTFVSENRRWIVLAEANELDGEDAEMGSLYGDGVPESDSGTLHVRRRSAAMKTPANQARLMTLGNMTTLGSPSDTDAPIAVRANFKALALFAPDIPTDAEGRASVRVTLPDNLTRYRVMVLAADATNRFGHGESTITAQKRISVRPSPPRFLNYGDHANLPVLVQNQTDKALDVDVAIRATNLTLTSGSSSGRRVRVPANDRVALRFPAAAASPGTARIQVVAASGTSSDAAEKSLPVWTPATTEAFATYGVIDEGTIRQPVEAPPNAIKDFGGLTATTSSTELQALTDAFIYLVEYPYECGEQIASRILSIAALRDVLRAFDAKGLPDAATLNKIVQRDIKKLEALQSPNGGFRSWMSSREPDPFVTAHVTQALARARAKGYDVPQRILASARGYLVAIRNHIPHWYGKQARWSIESYALNVRAQLGDVDISGSMRLVDEAGIQGLGIENLGWLYPVLASAPAKAKTLTEVKRYLNNQVVQTAATAHWTTRASDDDYLILASSRRADAILLEDMVRFQAKSPLIPKVVRGLLASRVRGRWGNTQENVFVLLALDAYFRKFEGVTPNFVAQVWLGDRYAGEHRFRGRTTERKQTDVPMSYLVAAGEQQDLVVQKLGKGRLYYRLAMNYAPEDLDLKPFDRGFEVTRVYEALDDPGDVRLAPDGTWEFKAGARVRVRLNMVAHSRRYHVALVDPLPAGVEPVNPDFAVSASIPTDDNAKQPSSRFWWWQPTWYNHQNLRDERAEAFATMVPAGVHEYTYVARATTTGAYIVPPAKAEEMYMPETFGRSGTTHVRVVD